MSEKLGGMEIIADVIRENYDLGEVQLPQQLEAAHQRRHRKMTVETSKGKFLAKTYKRDPVVLDALSFQHRLSDHLDKNGLPVARIQRTRRGTGVVEVDNWALELQQFIVGESMQVTTKTLAESAKALGKFHAVCRGVPVPPRDAQKWRFSEVPREQFQKLYENAREEVGEAKVSRYCDEIVSFLNDASKELHYDKRNEFEVGLIHGDWHGGNLMFHNEELKAIVDLEFAGDGCYLEDIAYGVSNLAIRTTHDEAKLRYRTFMILDYYQTHRTLAFAEMVALFYAVGVKHITTVSYQVPQHGKVAGYSAAEWIFRLAVQARWLGEMARKARWGEL